MHAKFEMSGYAMDRMCHGQTALKRRCWEQEARPASQPLERSVMTCTATIAATVNDAAASTTWSYTADDPWGFTVDFRVGTQTSTWLFGRELLADALWNGHAGAGDVTWTVEGNTVTLMLDTPEGIGVVLFARGYVEMFLSQTECVVPIGGETIDWSVEMRHVLA